MKHFYTEAASATMWVQGEKEKNGIRGHRTLTWSFNVGLGVLAWLLCFHFYAVFIDNFISHHIIKTLSYGQFT